MSNSAAKRGVIYVLTNGSFPDVVKIGRTARNASERARELSRATGVPTKFEVAYDAIVSDAGAAEKEIHSRLESYRVNPKREFFQVPIHEAMRVVQSVAARYPVDEAAEAVEFDALPAFEARMRRWLRHDLVAVKFIQFPDLCLVRWTVQPELTKREAIEKIFDLAIFGDPHSPDPEEREFSPVLNSPEKNFRLLLELDAYSMAMTGLDIISEDAANYAAFLKEQLNAEPPLRPEWKIIDTVYDAFTDDEVRESIGRYEMGRREVAPPDSLF